MKRALCIGFEYGYASHPNAPDPCQGAHADATKISELLIRESLVPDGDDV